MKQSEGLRDLRIWTSCASFAFAIFIRYIQIAVASFGPSKPSECGKMPAGFATLTPEVLDWVKTFTGMHHPGISSDPGESQEL